MDRPRPRVLAAAILVLAATVPACGRRPAVEELPSSRETLARVGRRLGASRSLEDLAGLAARGDRLLAALSRAERDALGRGEIRLRVDRPAVVAVAASRRATPFWLADQGFSPSATTLEVGGESWPLFLKRFDAGWIGLGVNALDRSAPEHYAVLIGPAGAGSLAVSIPDPARARAVAAAEGASAAFDADLPIRRIPAEFRGATLIQTSRGRRHANVLARGRVWKTHVPSTSAPDQVAIAFGEDPCRSLTWTWRTAPGVETTVLRLAPASPDGRGPADPGDIRLIRGGSQLVETADLLNDPAIRRHRVSVSDLVPDTLYAYAPGEGSRWETVRTAPSRPRSVRFLYLGDAQTGFEAWGRLLGDAHRRHPDARFVLLAGDLVDRGNERTNWDHFFLRARGVFDRLPLMPAVGNHEYLDQGPHLYTAFFATPRNGPVGIDPGLVYSFEYGDAFVAVLDSNLAIVDPHLARLQADWLDAALARTRASWTFVMFHHPVYASHPTRDTPALREAWVPVFDRHRVDLVLQGHDHAYLRTYPMRAHRPSAEGTRYIVSVSGDKFCDQAPRDYTEVGLTHLSTYQTIDIEVPERRLTYRAWDARGREVDRLVIEKPQRLARGAGAR